MSPILGTIEPANPSCTLASKFIPTSGEVRIHRENQIGTNIETTVPKPDKIQYSILIKQQDNNMGQRVYSVDAECTLPTNDRSRYALQMVTIAKVDKC